MARIRKMVALTSVEMGDISQAHQYGITPLSVQVEPCMRESQLLKLKSELEHRRDRLLILLDMAESAGETKENVFHLDDVRIAVNRHKRALDALSLVLAAFSVENGR